MATAAVTLLAGSALLLLVLLSSCSAQLCSKCECLPEYKPLCAYQEATGKYRGFRSLCELDCSNQCRKDKFVYVGQGRCGKYAQRQSSTTTTTTTPEDFTLAKPVEAGIFGPLLQALLGAAPQR